MLQNAYLLAKTCADTVENERNFAEILPKIGNYPTGPLPGAAREGSGYGRVAALAAPAGPGERGGPAGGWSQRMPVSKSARLTASSARIEGSSMSCVRILCSEVGSVRFADLVDRVLSESCSEIFEVAPSMPGVNYDAK